jgi:hypothetical protein
MIVPYSQYNTSVSLFPPDNISPKEKNEAWAKKVGEAIISLWLKDRTCVPYSKLEEIAELRDLANGNQNVLRYQKILLDESETTGEMEGYMNIAFDVFSVMPKFLRVVEGMFEQTEHNVIATAVDPKSSKEKEELKLKTAFRMQFKEDLQYIEQGLGLDNNSGFMPETAEELELYSGMGGFKLSRETELEEGLDYTGYISEWKEIKKKIIRDCLTFNAMCVKDYTDPYVGKVKYRYVDPAMFIGQYSKSYDHRNMRYGGEIIQESIEEIMKEDPKVDYEELRKFAVSYNGLNGNGLLNSEQLSVPFSKNDSSCLWKSFVVDVFDWEWKSINSEYWTTRTTQYGEDLRYKEEWGKIKNTDKKKTDVYDIHVVYKAKWVIGTDIVYNFGLQHDVPRPDNKEVALSYHFYKYPEKAIVQSSEPCLHQIALAHIKLQNAIAEAAPPGIAIEYTALQNMKLGGNKMEPLELIRMRKQNGDLIFKASTHKGQPNVPGGYRPIQELEGGLGRQLEEFIRIFEVYTEFIREVTGINQIADASTPNPEQSVGGSEIAIAATNNALRPVYSAYLTIKERLAKNACMRIQLLIKHNKKALEGYIPVIGQMGVQIISVGADVVDANYYIKYEAKPTDKRKEFIRQAAITAMSPDKDGTKSIELPDFLMIERLLENGNLKYAEAFLNYKSKKNKEKQLQLQRENMQLDKQRELEGIELKAQKERENMTFETDETIRLEKAKAEIAEYYKQFEHKREMEIKALDSTLGVMQNAASAETVSAEQSAT